MDIQKMQQDNSLMRDKQFPILHGKYELSKCEDGEER